MKKPRLQIGDLVYHCEKVKWGKETKTHPGLGLVTMIAGRNMRVMWRTGEVVWMTEDRLVHISNLIKLRKK